MRDVFQEARLNAKPDAPASQLLSHTNADAIMQARDLLDTSRGSHVSSMCQSMFIESNNAGPGNT